MAFLVRFLFRNLEGYRKLLVIAFIATVLEVQAALLPAVVTKDILEKVQFPGKDATDWTAPILNLFDHPAPGHAHCPATAILFLIVIFIVLGALDSGLTYVQQFVAASIGQNLSARLRQNLFDQLQRLTLDWHGKQNKGDLDQRITGDIANIEKLITVGQNDEMGFVVIIVTAVGYML